MPNLKKRVTAKDALRDSPAWTLISYIHKQMLCVYYSVRF